MAGVEEIRAGIAMVNEQCAASIAALQQAAQTLEEAQHRFAELTAGSTQSEVTQSQGLLAQALQGITGEQNTIQAAISSNESYSARL